MGGGTIGRVGVGIGGGVFVEPGLGVGVRVGAEVGGRGVLVEPGGEVGLPGPGETKMGHSPPHTPLPQPRISIRLEGGLHVLVSQQLFGLQTHSFQSLSSLQSQFVGVCWPSWV